MLFKPLPKYEEYLISESGDIWSTKSNKMFTKRKNSSGYFQVELTDGKQPKRFLVHRLVASAYLGLDIFDTSKEVDHIDNDKTNNHYSNLQILTRKQHLKKTLESQGFRARSSCSGCGVKLNNRYSSPKIGKCIRCRTKEKDLSEEELVSLIKEKGSWVQAAKLVGMSDNGLRKMYKRVSGGKDPKLVKKL